MNQIKIDINMKENLNFLLSFQALYIQTWSLLEIVNSQFSIGIDKYGKNTSYYLKEDITNHNEIAITNMGYILGAESTYLRTDMLPLNGNNLQINFF